MELRHTAYKNILRTIDKHSRFESLNFQISTSRSVEDDNNLRLTVTYLLRTEYFIVFDNIEGDKVAVFLRPGIHLTRDENDIIGNTRINEKIYDWLNALWEELVTEPAMQELNRQREDIEQLLEKVSNAEENSFTVDEGENLRKKLDELEKRFENELKKEIEDKKKYQRQISDLKKDIDTLRQTISVFSKKSWAREFLSKFWKWSNNPQNRKVLKEGYEVAKSFLPEDIKSGLPE